MPQENSQPSTTSSQDAAQSELTKVLLHLKEDPTLMGILILGKDGVLRSWDADRNVVDAAPLGPALIKAYLDRLPYDAAKEAAFRGVNGTNVPREEWFHPPRELVPEPLPEEHRERDEEVLDRYRQRYREKRDKIEAGTFDGYAGNVLSDNKLE